MCFFRALIGILCVIVVNGVGCTDESTSSDVGADTDTDMDMDTDSDTDTDTDTDSDTDTDTDTDSDTDTDTDADSQTDSDIYTDSDSGSDLGDSDVNSDSGTNTPEAPYANVMAVSVSGNSGAYTFSVSVESADIDCNQFADWWEVLSEDGTLIFRRILEHPHTDENGTSDPDAPGNTFTRSGDPVEVEADKVVIVRAHMSNGGYNGTAMRGSVNEGFSEAMDIDSQFAPGVEVENPLPEGCFEM
jgi:hypothetical protein